MTTGGSAGGSAETTTLSVSLSEFAITGDLTAPAGHVVLDVTTGGSMEHNLAFVDQNLRTSNIAAGASETLDLGELAPGTYRIICEIPTAELRSIEQQLPRLTHGDGGWVSSCAGYAPITGDAPARARIGPNPLNRVHYLAEMART